MDRKYKYVAFVLLGSIVIAVCIIQRPSLLYHAEKLKPKLVDLFQQKQTLLESDTDNLDPISSIKKACGELCDTTRKGRPGPYFDQVTADINCKAIYLNKHIDRGHGLQHAPKNIPKDLIQEYTMHGKIRLTHYYFDQQYLGKTAMTPVWKKDLIDRWIVLAKEGKLPGTYGAGETNALRDGLQHAPGVKDGRVLVIGSENPWVEACVLEAGAKEVVTLEYGRIVSEHPQVKTMVPYDFRMSYLNNTLGEFDAIVTFSSVEHSGLGRYGDGLNPWGDIIAIARSWCVAKTGASLTIGVMFSYENEFLRFNADRWYGKIRYPYLTTNWKLTYQGKGGQRVHVFIK